MGGMVSASNPVVVWLRRSANHGSGWIVFARLDVVRHHGTGGHVSDSLAGDATPLAGAHSPRRGLLPQHGGGDCLPAVAIAVSLEHLRNERRPQVGDRVLFLK